MTDEELRAEYERRHRDILQPLAARLTDQLAVDVRGLPRIDRISARAKSADRFLGKATKTAADGARKYKDPLNQIQDQIGARIVVFYLDDVEAVSKTIESYHRPIEAKLLVPESLNGFGYFGKHYILALPEDLFADDADRTRSPQFFELQIKTLFQHAWSEAEHDVGYKPEDTLTELQSRQLAFAAAQAWGADQIFCQIRRELSPTEST